MEIVLLALFCLLGGCAILRQLLAMTTSGLGLLLLALLLLWLFE